MEWHGLNLTPRNAKQKTKTKKQISIYNKFNVDKFMNLS